jgi:predicted nucleic acid-binding protein
VIAVDASVAFKWLVEERGSDAAVHLSATHPLAAPTLLRAEVGNALFKKVNAGAIEEAPAKAAHAALDAFIVEWVEMGELAASAFDVCCELRHPVYDCYYLALALQREIKLATVDERLVGKCRGTRFEPLLIGI